MVRSSFSDAEGTWIVPEADWMREDRRLRGGAGQGRGPHRDHRRARSAGHQPSRLRGHRRAEHRRGHDRPERRPGGKAAIGFTVLADELPTTLAVLGPLADELGARVEHEDEVSKVSIVGTGMRTHTGVAERMFAALAAEKVNMKMITTATSRSPCWSIGPTACVPCEPSTRRSAWPSPGREPACRLTALHRVPVSDVGGAIWRP